MSVELEQGELTDYWQESARPLVSLIFITPMLLAYEIGMIALGPAAIRNGAEVWLRQFLDALGFGQYFLLPGLTCGLLLAWHHVVQARWRFRPSVLWGMSLESVTLALGLLALAQLQSTLCGDLDSTLTCATRASSRLHSTWGQSLGGVLGYLGAGIYEELLFRLTLLPIVAVVFRSVGIAPRAAWGYSIVLVSVFFSLAHYQWNWEILGISLRTSGYDFDWFSFSFRCLAGTVFSLLFVCRGFGIAVGAHAMYDVFAVLV